MLFQKRVLCTELVELTVLNVGTQIWLTSVQ